MKSYALSLIVACMLTFTTGRAAPQQGTEVHLSPAQMEALTPNRSITAYLLGPDSRALEHLLIYGESLIGTEDGALYTSSNNGNTWQLSTIGAEAIIAAGPKLVIRSQDSYFSTTNFGVNWNPISKPSDHIDDNLGIVSDHGILWAADETMVYSSRDGGLSWHNVVPTPCSDIASMSARNDSLIIVCRDKLPGVSEDAQTYPIRIVSPPYTDWRKVPSIANDQNPEIKALFNDHLVATTDEGLFIEQEASAPTSSWINVTPPECDPSPFLLRVWADNKTIYAVCNDDLFVRSASSNTWTQEDVSFSISKLLLSSEYLVALGTDSGHPILAVSRDHGGNWTSSNLPNFISDGLIDGDSLLALTSSNLARFQLRDTSVPPTQAHHLIPANPATLTIHEQALLVAGTQLFSSRDSGQTWSASLPPLKSSSYHLMNAGGTVLVVGEHTIYKPSLTHDEWQPVPFDPKLLAVVACYRAKTIYAVFGTSSPREMHTSLQSLKPDSTAWQILRELPYSRSAIKGLRVDEDGTVYIATEHSLDRGVAGEWSNVLSGYPAARTVKNLEIDNNGNLLLGTNGGLYWSGDHGATWSLPNGSALQSRDIKAVQIVTPHKVAVKVSGRSYLLIDKLDTYQDVSSLLSLDIKASGTVDAMTIDDSKVDASALTVDSGDVKLRQTSVPIKSLPDGIHKLSVKLKDNLSSVSQDAYIYVEGKRAKLFKPYQRSFALVVAASGAWDRQEFPFLDQAVSQAKQLAGFLRTQGFEVKELYEENATSEHITEYIASIQSSAGPQDRVLLYFSGHGASVPGAVGAVGYLVTYPATQATMSRYGVPMSRLQNEYAAELRVKHVAFFIDACFSGLALQKAPEPSAADIKAFVSFKKLARYTNSPARDILVASQGDQSALDIHGGLFTSALLEGLKGGADYGQDGVITMEQLAVFVSDKVGAIAARQAYAQLPQLQELKAYGEGQFVFYKPN